MATIEINNKEFTADAGKMIIEVADEHDIYIPRFCYHKKLSIAANCRMCLVEVERVGKAVPACATPITDGMKVFTKSPKAIAAQKAVMEFLLINHPLDCPICDQGGECELQDLSMGFGTDVSRFNEGKRSVDDEDLGSLISTEMTRCIHCTRCVRFGDEVAGLRELGATGRGESMQIGTYIKAGMRSEVSGNIIDLCPVGALTSKPYRFTARAWELQQRSSIAAHDCVGSHIHLHVRANKVMRVVPKENEAINETWLSDRDRYGYLGIHSPDRLDKPMIKHNGHWIEVDWETALTHAVVGLQKAVKQHGAESFGGLISSQSTLEECYLFQKILRGMGSNNIDHRLQACDFRDDDTQALYPGMDIPLADIENQQAILLVGSHIHREQPIVGIRVRKASVNQAQVLSIHYVEADWNFDVALSIKTKVNDFVEYYAQIAKAALELAGAKEPRLEKLLQNVKVSKEAQQIAQTLRNADRGLIIVGQYAENHFQAATIRTLTKVIAEHCQVNRAIMSAGPNSVGACLAGALPHREMGGVAVRQPGLNTQEMLTQSLKAFLLMGVEPERDCADAALALQALQQAGFVVAITAYKSSAMLSYAEVLLPMTTYVETSGTFANVEGKLQSFTGAIQALGQSRPGWKILRVIGNLFALTGFDYNAREEITQAVTKKLAETEFATVPYYVPSELKSVHAGPIRIGHWSIYTGDPMVRRADALQQAPSSEPFILRVHPQLAKQHGLQNGALATVIQGYAKIQIPVKFDEKMAEDGVFLPCGFLETAHLRSAFGPVQLTAG